MRCLSVFDSSAFFTLFLFPLAAKLIGPRTGCQSLKNVDFPGIRPLKGQVCVSVYVLDRIVGFPEPLFSSSFAMRSPLWVESAYLCTYLVRTKVLTWLVLGFKFLRDGVTLLGRVSVPLYVLDRNEGFPLDFFLQFEFLRDGVTLFRVEYPYSCILDRIEETPCCWLLRPCLA